MGRKKKSGGAKSALLANDFKTLRTHEQHEQRLFRTVLSHALSSGWVQNSGIAALGALVALVVAIVTAAQTKAAIIALALSVTFFVWILAFIAARHLTTFEHPDFSLAIETSLTGKTRDSGILYCESAPKTLSPIPVAIYIRLVNLQSIPSSISLMKVEVLLREGKWFSPDRWIEGKDIPDYMPLASLVNPPSQSVRLFPVGSLLRVSLKDRPIPPHETTRGWILLDMPPSYDSSVQPRVLRITVADTAGHKGAYIHTFGSKSEDNVLPATGFRFQRPLDLTGYTISHLADIH